MLSSKVVLVTELRHLRGLTQVLGQPSSPVPIEEVTFYDFLLSILQSGVSISSFSPSDSDSKHDSERLEALFSEELINAVEVTKNVCLVTWVKSKEYGIKLTLNQLY